MDSRKKAKKDKKDKKKKDSLVILYNYIYIYEVEPGPSYGLLPVGRDFLVPR